MATAAPIRRTQEERSAETRGRILAAALETLASAGYAGTTTTLVADRAGVSRGAQLHHFPTRQALVSAAVQHLFADITAWFERCFAELAPEADRAGAAIDLLWEIFQDDRLAAVLDLYVAGRTDPELRAALVPVASAHRDNVLRLARASFPEAADRPEFDSLLDLVLDAIQGAAVRTLIVPDDPAVTRTLGHLKRLARAVLEGTAPHRIPAR